MPEVAAKHTDCYHDSYQGRVKAGHSELLCLWRHWTSGELSALSTKAQGI